MMFCVRFATVRSDTTCWWVSARTSVSATRSATSSPGNDKNCQDSYLHSIHSIVFHPGWVGWLFSTLVGLYGGSNARKSKVYFCEVYPTCVSFKLSKFFSIQVSGARPGWDGKRPRQLLAAPPLQLLGGLKPYFSPEKKRKIICPTQVCQACVSGPAGGTDVDNCLWKFIPWSSPWIRYHLLLHFELPCRLRVELVP